MLPTSCSMRPDLIGEGYAAALAELQDNVAPFDTEVGWAGCGAGRGSVGGQRQGQGQGQGQGQSVSP